MARINRVNNVLDDERDSSTLERLLEFGRKKKYVTYDDILHFFPDAEQDLDQLEEAYTALLGAGISYTEEDSVSEEPSEEELSEGSYREPTLDAFSQLRSGYKGGNTPNLFKSCNPCSKVNPKDVAKRRAKNKATRKNKRK